MDFIKKYWDNVSGRSWEDVYMVELEYRELSKLITPDESILDVGCGDGRLLSRLNAKIKTGIDFSDERIKAAKKRGGNFFVGDARHIDFDDGAFDTVYTVRCIINLPTWEQQQQAIKECIRVARKRVILSEGFYEPLQRLNALRQIAGLTPLEEHDFNRYIKVYLLREMLQDYNYIINNYSSVYYLGSRFMREIISDYTSYTNAVNTIFYNMSNDFTGGDFGIQKMCIIEL